MSKAKTLDERATQAIEKMYEDAEPLRLPYGINSDAFRTLLHTTVKNALRNLRDSEVRRGRA